MVLAAVVTITLVGSVVAVAYGLTGQAARHARVLAAGILVASGLLALTGLWGWYWWGAVRAGYECPSISSGAGRPSFFGLGEGTACVYGNGHRHNAEYHGPDWFFAPWQMTGLVLLTLTFLAAVTITVRRTTRPRACRHRIDNDSVPLTIG